MLEDGEERGFITTFNHTNDSPDNAFISSLHLDDMSKWNDLSFDINSQLLATNPAIDNSVLFYSDIPPATPVCKSANYMLSNAVYTISTAQ